MPCQAKYNMQNHRKIIVWTLHYNIQGPKFNKSLYIYIFILKIN